MKVKFLEIFYIQLKEIVDYIAKDKPEASRKFKKDLIIAIKKDLQFPYNYKKSTYFDDDTFRDYVHKGYTITCKINNEEQLVIILGIIKNKHTY
jgi:plasmid stabilization system protein ParE